MQSNYHLKTHSNRSVLGLKTSLRSSLSLTLVTPALRSSSSRWRSNSSRILCRDVDVRRSVSIACCCCCGCCRMRTVDGNDGGKGVSSEPQVLLSLAPVSDAEGSWASYCKKIDTYKISSQLP